MRQFLYTFLLILLLPTGLKATHIVGGEFNLVHIEAYDYSINLTLYFDDINGNPQALDQNVNLHFFRKFDNAFINTLVVDLDNDRGTFVNYTNPKCTTGTATVLRTKVFTYTRILQLTPEIFGHPGGYYVVWDRCCRNNTITNIEEPGGTGQLFYMEFPSVVRNGQPFVNSSPTLFKPLNDYACIGQLFQFDFGGEDSDGDSLVYSMAEPLRGLGTADDPRPLQPPSRVDPTVTWMPGFNINRQVRGALDLRIDSSTGRLNLIAGELGLHVFAIKVEEYRNGRKIGQVNREFQLLVRDCPLNVPPRVLIPSPEQQGRLLANNDTIRVDGRCFTLRLSDSLSNAPSDSLYLTVRSTLPGSTFRRQTTAFRVRNSLDTVIANYCLPGCDTSLINKYYPIRISLRDDGCSVPMRDSITINVYFKVENPRNPMVTLQSDVNQGDTITIVPGQTFSFNIMATDSGDLASITTLFPGGSPAFGHGYSLVAMDGNNTDTLRYTISFNPCNAVPGLYRYTWLATDASCPPGLASTYVYIRIVADAVPPVVSLPEPQFLKDGEPAYRVLAGQPIQIRVEGRDTTDRVYLKAFSPDLNPGINAIRFESNPAGARQFLSGIWTWNTTCRDTSSKPYRIYFVVEDSASCLLTERDTIVAWVYVDPDLPIRSYYMLSGGDTLRSLSASVVNGGEVKFELVGTSTKSIPMQLNMVTTTGTRNETFEVTQAENNIRGRFSYKAVCNDVSADSLIYAFRYVSEFCQTPTLDVIRVAIAVKDTAPSEFVPPNVVTVNGDNKNDSWYIYNRIPEQSCSFKLEQCTIYNRWGKPVFETTDPNFEWKPTSENTGLHFYHIRLRDKAYRGWIEVLGGSN